MVSYGSAATHGQRSIAMFVLQVFGPMDVPLMIIVIDGGTFLDCPISHYRDVGEDGKYFFRSMGSHDDAALALVGNSANELTDSLPSL